MSSRPLSHKQQNEQQAFAEFVRRMEAQGDWLSVDSRPEPEPDLLCIHAEDGSVAFELVSLTDSTIARVQAARLNVCHDAFWTSDPSVQIIRNKLSKKYTTSAGRIELLVYTNGRIITTDDEIIEGILPWFDACDHPFARVWFMGECGARFLWDAS
jgi:hypothetical protein